MCVGCVVILLVIACFRVAWNVWSNNVNIVCVWQASLCSVYCQICGVVEVCLVRVGACLHGTCSVCVLI